MLSTYSVKKPYTVLVAVVLVLVLGVISFLGLTTDLMPTINLPYMLVITPYPGASPERVESMVSQPLEAALGTTSGIVNVQSVSSENMSMMILEFEEGTNMDSATIDVSSMIDLAEAGFDDLVGAPSILNISPDMLPIAVASIDVEGMSEQEISNYVTDEIVPQFERLAGVASVDTQGLLETEISVMLDTDKINEVNLKVLNSVDSELADAQQELYDAMEDINSGLAEIESGQAELEQGSDAATTELANASAEVDAAVAQLSALMSESTTLETNEMAFEGEKQALEAVYYGLNGVPGSTNPAEQGLLTTFAAMLTPQQAILLPNFVATSTPIPTTTTELVNLPEALFTEYITAVNQIAANMPSTPGAPTIPTEALGMILTLTQEDVAVIENTPTRISQIDAELNNITTQKAVVAMMLPELQSNLDTLQAAYAELESGKMQAVNELTAGEVVLGSTKTDLEMAKEQLEQSQEDMDEAKEQALEQADITGFLTADMIGNIIMAENFNMPAGYIDSADGALLVKVGEEFSEIEELKNTVIFYADIDGVGEVKLSDIAKVEFTDNADTSYAKVNGNNSVLLSFQKQSTASTAEVSDEIEDIMAEIEEENADVNFTSLMDQGQYIDMVIQSVLSNLIYGGILAIFVLAIFLKDIRPTFIVACSIPFSLMCAITAMYFTDITLNIISLSGLSLGVGMLVDNSIVVIENIYRLRSEGVPAAKAAVVGARQVSGAIFASTLTTICVFLPIVFTEGISRDLFMDMGLTIAYALIASLFVALTLVPAMGATTLKNSAAKEQKWFERFAKLYERVLSKALNNKAPVLIFTVLLLAFSIYQVTQMGTAFIPAMESPQMSATMTVPKEATQEEIFETSDEVMSRISGIDGIDAVSITVGGGAEAMMMGASSGQSIQLYITLEEGTSLTNANAAAQIVEATQGLNCEIAVQESTMDMSAMGGSGIELVIKGNDFDTLDVLAEDMRSLFAQTEGVTDISQPEETGEEMRIIVNKNAAMHHNLTVAQIQMEIASALTSTNSATTITQEGDDYPVIVVRDDGDMPSEESIMSHEFEVTSMGADGETETVYLHEIADRQMGASVESVNRENGSRYTTVSAAIAEGYNIGLVSRDFEELFYEYEVPNGYSIDITGENETITNSINDLILVIILAVVFVYLIMVAQFQSLMSPFIVMFTIPLAFTGGLLALLITGNELSIVAMLGFLVLAGIVVNNGIVFVDTINQLRIEGMGRKQAILRTGRVRIRPVLMTALTTILAMVTMAMGIGDGSEMTQPLAIVTIGGLAYATLLTLFIVPILYDIMRKKDIVVVKVD